MNRLGKCGKLICVICSLVITFTFCISAYADTEKISEQEKLIGYAKGIVKFEKKHYGISASDGLLSGAVLDNAGQSNSDWLEIGISRFGFEDDYSGYLSKLSSNIAKRYETNEKLDKVKSTEWHRATLAVFAAGGNACNVGKINLVADGVYNRSVETLEAQGTNGLIWALCALDSYGLKTAENALSDRQKIISRLIKLQCSDGGFSTDGNTGETDITAMAVQMLSVYYNDFTRTDIRKSVDKAFDFLAKKYFADSSFGSSEACAQVLIALSAAGADYKTDKRFTDKKNILENLLEYQNSDGGFSHKKGEKSSAYSSAQVLCALAAAARNDGSLRRLYDFKTEFSVVKREQLDAVNGNFSSIKNEKEADKCNGFFWDLKADESTYIHGCEKLISLKDKYKLILCDRKIVNELGTSDGGKGCIYDMEKSQLYSTDSFGSSNMKKYKQLKSGEISSSDLLKCKALLSAANKDTKLENREEIIKNLRDYSVQSEKAASEIDEINRLVADKLYPFDNLDSEQKEYAAKLYKRTLKLSESDREKITGLSELEKCSGDNGKSGMTFYVCVCAVILFVAGLTAIFIRVKIMRKRKEEKL